jgi:pyridoxamine 5'-phosphate oxidase
MSSPIEIPPNDDTRLLEIPMNPDPIAQFGAWLEEARERSGMPNPNAMTLATATPDGIPSARIVLLKGFNAEGFEFYTNYESAKGRELAANPRAALIFHWDRLDRQIRIAGRVERVSREQSAEYFHTRPRQSQLAAWASDQSRPIESRAALAARYRAVEERYADGEAPLPPYWGGFRLIPESIEFWVGHRHRLHDRFVYRRAADGGWTRERLMP